MPDISPPPSHSTAAEGKPPSPFAPLQLPVFRMLWLSLLAANVCMWMNDVAAAWMMMSLTSSPIWVALVQTASTLPVFLLGLPSGALADILDRRRYFMFTQCWLAVVALLTCITVWADAMTPVLLLALTFANGVGLCMRWPVFAAIVPELVPRPHLPAALALNGVAMNGSRIVGPLVAGALIAGAGSEYVFLLNAGLLILSALIIMRWRRVQVPSPLGRERLWSAMRVGAQFVRQSARVKTVLLHIAVFFFHSTALLALLPLVAKGLHGGTASTFTMLLAAMGGGAIAAAMCLPRLRQLAGRGALVGGGSLLHSAMMATVAYADQIWLAVLAMFLSGTGWIVTANSLSVSIQMALPDWVRARVMSLFQMALMGATAAGAALWGQLASHYSVHASLAAASVSGILVAQSVYRFVQDRGIEEDLTPSHDVKVPDLDVPLTAGRIQVRIEYRIDPARAAAFEALMQESRRSRLRQGALDWDLLRDLADPGCFVEIITDENWTEHLRRFDRVTAGDVALRERKLAFHVMESAPRVSRYVSSST